MMFAVIMAGGSGTRFWPASRKHKPKQFLNITGKGPMLIETMKRLRPLAQDGETLIVLGTDHLQEARALIGDRPVHLLAEPVGRNTAPCIGLGALYALHTGWEGPVAFLPADHYVGNPTAFLDAIRAAGDVARKGGIVTLGIVPTRPETGYGYIRREQAAGQSRNLEYYSVSSFVEKPDSDTACRYLTDGGYYWNAGIFIATPETIKHAIQTHLPDLYEGLGRLENTFGTPQFETELAEVYGALDSISFDYGIMEKTGGEVFVLPCDCGWSDVGSWASLYTLRASEHDARENLVEGDAVLIKCNQTFAANFGGRLLACVGLKNCLVVETQDCVLVADLTNSQEIREVVERLKTAGREELL
jgi:mannose-1-phosphate guanylyltransferase